jgi:hypothetical protein
MRAMGDLELALHHLHDDIEIPEISLTIHPEVKRLIAEVLSQYSHCVTVFRLQHWDASHRLKILAASLCTFVLW